MTLHHDKRSRTRSRRVSIALPVSLYRELERIARHEGRTVSDLMREAIEWYLDLSDVKRIAMKRRERAACEAEVQGKKITLTSRILTDRELALAMEDVRRGRVIGPFRSAKAMLDDLHRRVARRQRRKRAAKTD